MSEDFPRSARLLRSPEFRAVFRCGRSRSDRFLIIYVRPRDEGGPTRLGLVVGRKFGNAVHRNVFKRRIREAFRRRRSDLPAEHDLIVLPVSRGVEPTAAEAEASLVSVAGKAAEAYVRKGPRC